MVPTMQGIKIIFGAAAFLLAFYGVKSFRRWTLQKGIFDVPNERSSHHTPVPRGGGLIIVLVTVTVFLLYQNVTGSEIFWAFYIGAILIAGISWIDDLYSISVGWRFLVHSLAAALAVWGLGCPEQIYLPLLGAVYLGKAAWIVWFLWIVWLINAYNFMDGIDGIAGIQAVSASLGWVLIAYFLGYDQTQMLSVLIFAASLGFLIHNWQPANIFMGDVGSAFLGYTFAVLPLTAYRQNPANEGFLLLIGLFLVWLFVFDSVLTVVRRFVRGEKIWQPHRQHLYQKLVIKGFSHKFVSVLYGILSTFIIGLTIVFLFYFQKHLVWLFAMVLATSLGVFLFVKVQTGSGAALKS